MAGSPREDGVMPAIPETGSPLETLSPAATEFGRVPWYRRRLWRTLRRGSGVFNVVFLLAVTFAALAAPWISHPDPTFGEPAKRLRPPAWEAVKP